MPRPLGYKRRDAKKLEARRIAAMGRVQRGESTSAVARSSWVCASSRFNDGPEPTAYTGKKGFATSRSPGQHRLSPEKLARLPDLLARGPIAHGFETPVWTSERVALLIWRHFLFFQVRYSFDYVKHLLLRIGWRWHEHTWLPSKSKNFNSQTLLGEHAAFPTSR